MLDIGCECSDSVSGQRARSSWAEGWQHFGEVRRRVSGVDKCFTSIDIANQYNRKLPKWLRAYKNWRIWWLSRLEIHIQDGAETWVTSRTLRHFSLFWRLKPSVDYLLADRKYQQHHLLNLWRVEEDVENTWENNISREEVDRGFAPLCLSTKCYSVVQQGIVNLVDFSSDSKWVKWSVLWY